MSRRLEKLNLSLERSVMSNLFINKARRTPHKIALIRELPKVQSNP
jgi:hypothetical protein